MANDIDLRAVNHALSELTRLQLAREVDPETAWRTRRELLEGVESYWNELAAPELKGPAPSDAPAEAAMPVPRQPWKLRLRALASRFGQWLLRHAWRLPLWLFMLFFAVTTFVYVTTL